MTELESLREEIAALRREVASLRSDHSLRYYHPAPSWPGLVPCQPNWPVTPYTPYTAGAPFSTCITGGTDRAADHGPRSL